MEILRRGLPAGDYAVELDGRVVASVERKSLSDLSSSLLDGSLRLALPDLAALPRAAVVVEDRYSRLFKLEHVRASTVADVLAETQVRCPSVPIVFTETRPPAEEWTYRFLAAALMQSAQEDAASGLEFGGGRAPATAAQVRAWAVAQDLPVSHRGRLRPEVWDAYRSAH